jgi:TetR/AcrR family transcriptional regulator
VATIQAAAIGVINLAPMMKTTFGVDVSSPQARAAHEDMIVQAVLGGLLTPEAALTLS